MKRFVLVPAVFAWLVSSSAEARVERREHDERVAVALHGPASCPSRDELVRAAKERSPSLVVERDSTDGASVVM
ncbi:MAG: hypothetical protein K0S65_4783, partial [Labilithrix sp.]|nr:hypothetical protein [Labilithrix sp.]